MSNKPRTREHFPKMKVRGNNGRLREMVAAIGILQGFTDRWLADLLQISFERDARENGWAHAYMKRALMKNLHDKSPARYAIPKDHFHVADPYWVGRGYSADWVAVDEVMDEIAEEERSMELRARRWLPTYESGPVVETKPQIVSP